MTSYQSVPLTEQKTAYVVEPIVSASHDASTRTTTATSPTASWRRVGLAGCAILPLGTILILAAVCLLSMNWVEAARAAEGPDVRMPWRYVLDSSRAGTVVTISTAIIRAVLALQAPFITMMLAAIVLERLGAPLLHVPRLSTLRAIGSNPSSLLSTMMRKPKSLSICSRRSTYHRHGGPRCHLRPVSLGHSPLRF